VSLCEYSVNGASPLTHRKSSATGRGEHGTVNAPLHRHLLLQAPLEDPTARELLAAARSLREVACTPSPAPLRGKNIAVIGAAGAGTLDADFAAAAAGLGARVARIEPEAGWVNGEAEPSADTARLLDHLYDAVDCEALPPGFARRLQERLEVPVYQGLARADHPIFSLLPALAARGAAPDATDRRALLQAALVSTLL
jgi:ornithine carbamoyltransferase